MDAMKLEEVRRSSSAKEVFELLREIVRVELSNGKIINDETQKTNSEGMNAL